MAEVRDILQGQEARAAIKEGIDLFANVIGKTLGPRGRNVVLDTNPYAPPLVTNDGVTIARELQGTTPASQIGAKLAREVASKTNDVAGDGTSTATVLFRAIVAEAMKALSTDADAVAVRAGIEAAAEAVVEAVEGAKTNVDDLHSLTAIATISSGSTQLGELVGKVVHELGADALVTIEDSPEADTRSEVSEGLELRGGIQSPRFIADPAKQQTVMERVPVFVTNHAITTGLEAVKLMEAASGRGFKHAVLIASSIDGEALATCFENWVQGKFQLLPLRVAGFGPIGEEALRDVAAVTGGRFFDRQFDKLPTGRDDFFAPEFFGEAGRVVATRDKVTVLDGAGDKDARIAEVEAQLETLRDYEADSAKERIAKMRSGVGRIYVGGVTDTERGERKLRLEDAVNATKAALSSGVVPGGGTALYRAAHEINADNLMSSDFLAGFNAVKLACNAPLKQMAANGSFSLDRHLLQELDEEPESAVDWKTGELVNAMKSGVIDPTRVVTAALSNAASAAAMFVVTEAAVVVKPEEPQA